MIEVSLVAFYWSMSTQIMILGFKELPHFIIFASIDN